MSTGASSPGFCLLTDFAAPRDDALTLYRQLIVGAAEQAAGAASAFIDRHAAGDGRTEVLYGYTWAEEFGWHGKVVLLPPALLAGGAVTNPSLRDALADLAQRVVRLAKDPSPANRSLATEACARYLREAGVEPPSATQQEQPIPGPPAEQIPPALRAVTFLLHYVCEHQRRPRMKDVLAAVPDACKASLYRNKEFRAAWLAAKAGLQGKVRRGHKNADGGVEAVDDAAEE